MNPKRSKYGAVATVVDGVSKGALRNRRYRERKSCREGHERQRAAPWETLGERMARRSHRVGECLIWSGTKIEGYAWIRWDGKGFRVSRLVLEKKLGRPLLVKMLACHTCDDPSCIEETHLFEGTHRDNRGDMDNKGRCRPAKGEKVHTAKLTAENVRAIRSSSGTLKEIGARFGVSLGQISKIKRGLAWLHV